MKEKWNKNDMVTPIHKGKRNVAETDARKTRASRHVSVIAVAANVSLEGGLFRPARESFQTMSKIFLDHTQILFRPKVNPLTVGQRFRLGAVMVGLGGKPGRLLV